MGAQRSQEERVAYRERGGLARDRLPAALLLALVVLVLLAWSGLLVYLAVRFL